MTLKFKPEDFDFEHSRRWNKPAAQQAQNIFDTWLAEQQVVYGRDKDDEDDDACWTRGTGLHDTHKARLVAVEEIAPAKCKHDGVIESMRDVIDGHRWYRCHDCGKELKPTAWEEVK